MPFLCYLCHLGSNRGFRFLPFWKTAIIFLSMNRYVWFIQGEMAKCGGAASFVRRSRASRGRLCGGHARVCFLRKAVAGGLASFARRSRVGLRQPGQLCPGNCVRGQLRPVAHLRLAHLCPWNLRLGTPASDGHPRPGGICVRAAAGHTGFLRAHPHPGLRHPGAPASGVRYKQCRRRPAKHAKRRRHKARRRGGQRGNSFHSCR